MRYIIPVYPWFNSPHDDLYMVELAEQIIKGNWLGEWNSTSQDASNLYKPPGYAIFLALSHFINISPAVVLVFVYLIISYIFVNSLDLLTPNQKLFLYTALSFNPILYSNGFSRVYRESLLLILLWSSISLTLFLILKIMSNKKIKTPMLCFILFFNSLIIGYVKITKSDIYIFTLIPFLASLLYFFYKWRIIQLNFKIIILLTFLVSLGLQLPQNIVKELNYRHYGLRLIEDNNSGYFGEAWKEMARIKVDNDPLGNFPISPLMIKKLSTEIPSFSIISSFMLGDTGWKNSNCESTGECSGFSGGWLQNEFRDAAIVSGVADSPKEFQEYFKKLSVEINDYCKVSKNDCRRPAIYFGGPSLDFEKINFKGSLDSSSLAFSTLLSWNGVQTVRNIYSAKDLSEIKSKVNSFNYVVSGIKYRTSNIQPTNDSLQLTYSIQFIKRVYEQFTNLIFILIILYFIFLSKYVKSKNRITVLDILIFSNIILLVFLSVFYGFIHANGWFILNASEFYFIPFSPIPIIFQFFIVIRLIEALKILTSNSNKLFY